MKAPRVSFVSVWMALLVLLAACQPITAVNQAQGATDAAMAKPAENIVLGIINAPTTPGGIIADLPTSINVALNAPGVNDQYASDPAAFGHQIPAGGRMELEFGGTFVRNGVDNDAEFVPMNSNATVILVAGNAQSAIAASAGPGPQHGNYTVEDDGDKLITVRPNGGSGDMGLEGERAQKIGFKTIHVTPTFGSTAGPAPLQNGPSGSEGTIAVRIYNADGELLESGQATLEFPTTLGPQVAPINLGYVTPMQFSPDVITEFVEATNFQHVAPGTQLVNSTRGESFSAGLPYAPRFLLMDAMEKQPDFFGPMMGIPGVGIAVNADDPTTATLIQDTNGDGALDESDTVVGAVTISGPSAASPGQILMLPDAPLTVSGDGLEGSFGSFLDVPLEVGSEPGIYATTVTLDGGNSATIYTVVD
ncbi:MAG: hypothetical protein R3C14_20355 [Caldilineaceae bacterium]